MISERSMIPPMQTESLISVKSAPIWTVVVGRAAESLKYTECGSEGSPSPLSSDLAARRSLMVSKMKAR